ncbi:hypothetical protein [Profundibacter sp.]
MPDGKRFRLANTQEGHAQLIDLVALRRDIVLCFAAMRGKRAIGGGRRSLRHVLFQVALVASHHNKRLSAFADRLHERGKPHKVIIIAVARKLVTIANALCKSRQMWNDQPI